MHRTELVLRYQHYHEQELTVGDVLALDRTRMANERTFLAYLRAALMLAVSAFSILKLLPDQTVLVGMAWVLLPTSCVLGLVGTVRSIRMARSLRRLEQTTVSSKNSKD